MKKSKKTLIVASVVAAAVLSAVVGVHAVSSTINDAAVDEAIAQGNYEAVLAGDYCEIHEKFACDIPHNDEIAEETKETEAETEAGASEETTSAPISEKSYEDAVNEAIAAGNYEAVAAGDYCEVHGKFACDIPHN